MPQYDETMITPAVLRSFDATPNARLRQIVTSLTDHLHAFVRETKLTLDEWSQGIEFLTSVGQMCDGSRQEFILLSDVLGVSMLVDAVNHASDSTETDTTVLGPFFIENSPAFAQGADIAGGTAGDPLYVDVRVSDVDGLPIQGAKMEVWQSDSEGFYDVQRPDIAQGFKLRGTLTSDGEGRVRFWSILPTAYPIPHDGPVGRLLEATSRHPWRPAHLHFKLAAQGFRTVVTHLFVKDDRYLASDAVFGVKDSLICEFPRHAAGIAPDGRRMDRSWHTLTYDFVLGPAPEAAGSPILAESTAMPEFEVNRRIFLAGGLIAGMLSLGALAGAKANTSGGGGRPARLHKLLVNRSIPESVRLGDYAGSVADEVVEFDRDFTSLWIKELRSQWSTGPRPIAGLTAPGVRMVLEQFGRDHDARIVFSAEHRKVPGGMRHRLVGCDTLVQSPDLRGGTDWVAEMARHVSVCPHEPSLKATSFDYETAVPPGLSYDVHQLVT